jgi:signal transduction histidine kinase
MNIVFASESFFKSTKCRKAEVYGSGLSIFAVKESLMKISSAVEISRNNVPGYIKIDDIQFSFNNVNRVFDLEIYPVYDSEIRFTGVFIHILDLSFEKKCIKMDRTIRRMSAVANFAGGIAHDYNNALTAVLGNISLAKMDAEKDSELEELLKDAESAGLKIKTLTERLGMFSRGMKPLKAKTDIKVLIENLISEVFAGFNGICNADIQDNMTHAEIDPELIYEAIRHVFENALDAADQSAGEVTIGASETEIINESVFRETTLVPGRYIKISVRDNGSGLDPHSLSEIFDPYITTKTGREGLGLALTYTILKRHRGFISADTSDKGGAEFMVYIPLF